MPATAVTDDELAEISFPGGLPGFPDAHRFALVSLGEDSPFSVLRSLDDERLEFVVVPPGVFFPEYAPELDDMTASELGLREAEDAIVLSIVNVRDGVASATLNLRGPLVINRATRCGSQVILAGDHDVRAPLQVA